jgi:SAM-dependent methyltransferase
MPSNLNVPEWFGSIDIYLFDQILKGRLKEQMKLLDAGCGAGRNLIYFFRSGYDVYGVDQSREAIEQIRRLTAAVAPHLPADNFRVEAVEDMSFDDEQFDLVISSAVLHFARDEEHWRAMVKEMWRVLQPGGIFFARLASTIGMEAEVDLIEGRRYHLPDGSDRFLVNEQMLLATTESLGAQWLEPLKTVVVQHARSMSNWCLRKSL